MEYLISYYLFGFEISILKFFFYFNFKYSNCNNFLKEIWHLCWCFIPRRGNTYRVSIIKCVTGAFRGCCECAQDKFTERDVKLINNGRSGGSGTSAGKKREKCQLSVECKWKSCQGEGDNNENKSVESMQK